MPRRSDRSAIRPATPRAATLPKSKGRSVRRGGEDTTTTRLKPMQRRPLLAVVQFIEQHRHAPTCKELAAILDQSESHTTVQVRDLIAAGYLKRSSRAWRDLEVTKLGRGVSAQ